MQLKERINAFVSLGGFLKTFAYNEEKMPAQNQQAGRFFEKMQRQMENATAHNRWHTAENLRLAFKNWAEALSEENLKTWLAPYDFKETCPKTVAIVMAGNIPLVGFHDFLSVLISGNRVLIKLSSNDKQIFPLLAEYLIAAEPGFENHISFSDGKLSGFDAVIATGSDNSARYFEYYFKNKPHLIRKSRNSIAVLTGKETPEQLKGLATDIFSYFGLGCRSVSKLFVPENYDFNAFFDAMFAWKELVHNNKYINNYDYNKAVYLMSDAKLLDNGFLLLKEDSGLASPIAVVFYETYSELKNVEDFLIENSEKIQAIVSDSGIKDEIPFGASQGPKLWEYADGVDTLRFLLKIT